MISRSTSGDEPNEPYIYIGQPANFDEVQYIHYPQTNRFVIALFADEIWLWSHPVDDAELDAIVGASVAADMRAGRGEEVPEPGEEVLFKSLTVRSKSLSERDKDFLQYLGVRV